MFTFREFFQNYIVFKNKDGTYFKPNMSSHQLDFINAIEQEFYPRIYHGRTGTRMVWSKKNKN